ncbi:50S ribosomal protein L4 [Candidatus Woesearchaeota archaeon]|nr:50S ribosomal protein L4 [Candidatus Woesearchaeota archaeon]
MKAILKSMAGETKGEVALPAQFSEPVRPDLIKRAVQAIQSRRKQPYGTDPEAGKKYSSKLSRRRRDYKGAYGIGISRVPRKIMSYRGTRFNWQAATAPNTVGGRQAHPPKAEKVFEKKINKKENRKAIRSAMAASVVKALVEKRGHVIKEYPIVLEDNVEDMFKTKDVYGFLNKLGLDKELERASKKTEKTGNAASRGRKFKKRIGPLFVVAKKCNLLKAGVNIPGVDVVEVTALNAELLAPGSDYGRLTLYTKGAIEMLDKQKLFTEDYAQEKKEKTAKKKPEEKKKEIKK